MEERTEIVTVENPETGETEVIKKTVRTKKKISRQIITSVDEDGAPLEHVRITELPDETVEVTPLAQKEEITDAIIIEPTPSDKVEDSTDLKIKKKVVKVRKGSIKKSEIQESVEDTPKESEQVPATKPEDQEVVEKTLKIRRKSSVTTEDIREQEDKKPEEIKEMKLTVKKIVKKKRESIVESSEQQPEDRKDEVPEIPQGTEKDTEISPKPTIEEKLMPEDADKLEVKTKVKKIIKKKRESIVEGVVQQPEDTADEVPQKPEDALSTKPEDEEKPIVPDEELPEKPVPGDEDKVDTKKKVKKIIKKKRESIVEDLVQQPEDTADEVTEKPEEMLHTKPEDEEKPVVPDGEDKIETKKKVKKIVKKKRESIVEGLVQQPEDTADEVPEKPEEVSFTKPEDEEKPLVPDDEDKVEIKKKVKKIIKKKRESVVEGLVQQPEDTAEEVPEKPEDVLSTKTEDEGKPLVPGDELKEKPVPGDEDKVETTKKVKKIIKKKRESIVEGLVQQPEDTADEVPEKPEEMSSIKPEDEGKPIVCGDKFQEKPTPSDELKEKPMPGDELKEKPVPGDKDDVDTKKKVKKIIKKKRESIVEGVVQQPEDITSEAPEKLEELEKPEDTTYLEQEGEGKPVLGDEDTSGAKVRKAIKKKKESIVEELEQPGKEKDKVPEKPEDEVPKTEEISPKPVDEDKPITEDKDAEAAQVKVKKLTKKKKDSIVEGLETKPEDTKVPEKPQDTEIEKTEPVPSPKLAQDVTKPVEEKSTPKDEDSTKTIPKIKKIVKKKTDSEVKDLTEQPEEIRKPDVDSEDKEFPKPNDETSEKPLDEEQITSVEETSPSKPSEEEKKKKTKVVKKVIKKKRDSLVEGADKPEQLPDEVVETKPSEELPTEETEGETIKKPRKSVKRTPKDKGSLPSEIEQQSTDLPEDKPIDEQPQKTLLKLTPIKIERKEVKPSKLVVHDVKEEVPQFTTMKLKKIQTAPKKEVPQTEVPKMLLKSRITRIPYPPEIIKLIITDINARVQKGILSRNVKEAEIIKKKKLKLKPLPDVEPTELEEFEPLTAEKVPLDEEVPEEKWKPSARQADTEEQVTAKIPMGKGKIPENIDLHEEVVLKPFSKEQKPEEKPEKSVPDIEFKPTELKPAHMKPDDTIKFVAPPDKIEAPEDKEAEKPEEELKVSPEKLKVRKKPRSGEKDEQQKTPETFEQEADTTVTLKPKPEKETTEESTTVCKLAGAEKMAEEVPQEVTKKIIKKKRPSVKEKEEIQELKPSEQPQVEMPGQETPLPEETIDEGPEKVKKVVKKKRPSIKKAEDEGGPLQHETEKAENAEAPDQTPSLQEKQETVPAKDEEDKSLEKKEKPKKIVKKKIPSLKDEKPSADLPSEVAVEAPREIASVDITETPEDVVIKRKPSLKKPEEEEQPEVVVKRKPSLKKPEEEEQPEVVVKRKPSLKKPEEKEQPGVVVKRRPSVKKDDVNEVESVKLKPIRRPSEETEDETIQATFVPRKTKTTEAVEQDFCIQIHSYGEEDVSMKAKVKIPRRKSATISEDVNVSLMGEAPEEKLEEVEELAETLRSKGKSTTSEDVIEQQTIVKIKTPFIKDATSVEGVEDKTVDEAVDEIPQVGKENAPTEEDVKPEDKSETITEIDDQKTGKRKPSLKSEVLDQLKPTDKIQRKPSRDDKESPVEKPSEGEKDKPRKSSIKDEAKVQTDEKADAEKRKPSEDLRTEEISEEKPESSETGPEKLKKKVVKKKKSIPDKSDGPEESEKISKPRKPSLKETSKEEPKPDGVQPEEKVSRKPSLKDSEEAKEELKTDIAPVKKAARKVSLKDTEELKEVPQPDLDTIRRKPSIKDEKPKPEADTTAKESSPEEVSLSISPKKTQKREEVEQNFNIQVHSYGEEDVTMRGKVKLPRKKPKHVPSDEVSVSFEEEMPQHPETSDQAGPQQGEIESSDQTTIARRKRVSKGESLEESVSVIRSRKESKEDLEKTSQGQSFDSDVTIKKSVKSDRRKSQSVESEIASESFLISKHRKESLVEKPTDEEDISENITLKTKRTKKIEDIEQRYNIQLGTYDEEDVSIEGKIKLPRRRSGTSPRLLEEDADVISIEELPYDENQSDFAPQGPKEEYVTEEIHVHRRRSKQYSVEETQEASVSIKPRKKKDDASEDSLIEEKFVVRKKQKTVPEDEVISSEIRLPSRRKPSHQVEENVEETFQVNLKKMPNPKEEICEDETFDLKVRRKSSVPTFQRQGKRMASKFVQFFLLKILFFSNL